MKLYQSPHNQMIKQEVSQTTQQQDSIEFPNDQFETTKFNRKTKMIREYKYKQKGYTFGHHQYNGEKKLDTPGPGHYQTIFSEKPVSYTIGVRCSEKSRKSEVPPLGVYEIKGLDRYGYYSNSKFKNSCATMINPPKINNTIKQRPSPGPGYYNIEAGFSEPGKYQRFDHFLSNYKTRHGWVMGDKSLNKRQPYY